MLSKYTWGFVVVTMLSLSYLTTPGVLLLSPAHGGGTHDCVSFLIFLYLFYYIVIYNLLFSVCLFHLFLFIHVIFCNSFNFFKFIFCISCI